MLVVELGYNSIVMPAKDAVLLAEIMQRAEKYEKKYRRDDGGYTYHVWPNTEEIVMRLISDDVYRMAKLAGKPDEK